MVQRLPEESHDKLKKTNRLRRQTNKNKPHKIVHESGRSTKDLWRLIIAKSKRK